ncbi:MAG TPA: hypothetical protein VF990_15080 [Candidatus Dormibacteraeota bacterium]
MGNPGQDVELTQRRYGLVDAGDDLVRILMKLTVDMERFDSMVSLQRELLQREGAFENDQLEAQWEGLRSEALQLLASVRQALERLRRLSEMARPVLHEPTRDQARV